MLVYFFIVYFMVYVREKIMIYLINMNVFWDSILLYREGWRGFINLIGYWFYFVYKFILLSYFYVNGRVLVI